MRKCRLNRIRSLDHDIFERAGRRLAHRSERKTRKLFAEFRPYPRNQREGRFVRQVGRTGVKEDTEHNKKCHQSSLTEKQVIVALSLQELLYHGAHHKIRGHGAENPDTSQHHTLPVTRFAHRRKLCHIVEKARHPPFFRLVLFACFRHTFLPLLRPDRGSFP